MYIYATSGGVYATDGADAGTVLLQATGADFVPLPNTPMVTLANGKVLFFALVNPSLDPTTGFASGIRIWETDGTVGGTTLTGTTMAPDLLQSGPDSIGNVVAIGNKVAFTYNFSGATVPYVTDGTTAGTFGASTVLPARGAVTVTCFLAGTRITTRQGEAPVEALRPGDTVRTASGATARVVWIGYRRIDATRRPARSARS